MELSERLAKVLETEYGIFSYEELVEAMKAQEPVDIGVFLYSSDYLENGQKAVS